MNNPYKPWKAVTLAYDPAYKNTMGVSIFVNGEYRMSGFILDERRKYHEISYWVQCAYAIARGSGLPLVCFVEDWTKAGARNSHKSDRSLGASRGWWEQEIYSLPIPDPTLGVMDTEVKKIEWSLWRTALFGKGNSSVKEQAVRFACGLADRVITDHNESESVCINHFGSRWDGVDVTGLERCE